MNAAPLLQKIAATLDECRLEAVLIGNAAAALHGAPVTTIDFDFLFRITALNRRKLKCIADKLEATIPRPYYPASGLFRLVNDDVGLQLDFMTAVDGVRSFAAWRSRATRLELAETTLLVASLEDVIRNKRAAGRPRDLATLPVLEKTLEEANLSAKSKS